MQIICNGVTLVLLHFFSKAKNLFKYLLLLVALSLVACGGSEGTTTTLEQEQEQEQEQGGAQLGIVIPGLDEPNIRFPDLVIDDNGTQHAVAADINGAVFYARCDEQCDLLESWSSVAIATFEFEEFSTETVVPKIQLTSSDQPRVVVFHTNSVLSATPSWYYQCDAVDCLVPTSWSGQEAFTMIGVSDYDIYRASAFTLTQDDTPRVSWLGPPGVLSYEDDALFYASCDLNCATVGEWVSEVVRAFNLSNSTLADIVIDEMGTQHIAFFEQIIGSDEIDITYIACAAMCDTSAPQWHPPVVLTTRNQELVEALSLRLFLTPAGQPAIAVYDPLPLADMSLSLFRCVESCISVEGWESTTPINLNSFDEDIVSFGRGLDAATVDGKLTLQFTAKRREDLHATLLYRASCSADCDTMAAWSLIPVADTSNTTLDNEGICQFVGVEIDGPTTIAAEAVSYEMVPYWFCGDYDFIEIDDSGNRQLVSNPDIRFFEYPVVTQLNTP